MACCCKRRENELGSGPLSCDESWWSWRGSYVRDVMACESSRTWRKEDGMSSWGFMSVGDIVCEWTVSTLWWLCVAENEGMCTLLHAVVAWLLAYACVWPTLYPLVRQQHLRSGQLTPAEQMGVNWMHPCRASLTLNTGTGCRLPFQFTHGSLCQVEETCQP